MSDPNDVTAQRFFCSLPTLLLSKKARAGRANHRPRKHRTHCLTADAMRRGQRIGRKFYNKTNTDKSLCTHRHTIESAVLGRQPNGTRPTRAISFVLSRISMLSHSPLFVIVLVLVRSRQIGQILPKQRQIPFFCQKGTKPRCFKRLSSVRSAVNNRGGCENNRYCFNFDTK